ncbi:MAG: type I-C CRISPR-associated protein Cas8c/Csd1 [Bacilli bacterium]|jgi:CRISPR-associated protein Csd1
MIISALCNYYDILVKGGYDIPLMGFSKEKIYFEFVINKNSELVAIIPLEQIKKVGKKEYNVPTIMTVPQSVIKANAKKSNFLYEKADYVIGLCNSDKEKDIKNALEKLKIFKDLHHSYLDDSQSERAKIFLNFIDNYHYDKYNDLINPYSDKLLKGLIVFRVDGKYLHEDEEILECWEKNREEQGKVMQCAITGKKLSIARLHPKIKGVRDAQSSGASIVSFNATAFESYTSASSQGLNAPISESVAFKYTTALNYMLSNDQQKINISDTTIVFWAESVNTVYQDIINLFFNPPTEIKKEGEIRDVKTEKEIHGFFNAVKEGTIVDYESLKINPNTKTYILGLSPNVSRISIRFFYANTFKFFINKLSEHYQDMMIEKQFNYEFDSIPIWKILNEVKKPESKKDSNPLLSGSLMRAIINGTMYPRLLFNLIMNRIRCDRDKENVRQINYTRVSIIKAYLNRLNRFYNNKELKEVLTVSLNEQTTQMPYLLGRLFAVLEKAQKDANPNIEATIKDRYFASACATPASVFPVLLKLAQNHISKAEYGRVSDRRISEILDKMEVTEFPAYLSLEEQGTFVIGYYHQVNSFYKKQEKDNLGGK